MKLIKVQLGLFLSVIITYINLQLSSEALSIAKNPGNRDYINMFAKTLSMLNGDSTKHEQKLSPLENRDINYYTNVKKENTSIFNFSILVFVIGLINLLYKRKRVNLNLTEMYSTGHSEKKNITDIVEVSIYPDSKFIISEVLGTVVFIPEKFSTDYSASDLSNPNKWSISEKRNGTTGKISTTETSVAIDRNTGFITYNNSTNFKNGDWIREYGNGNCQKVDTSKKKF